MNGTLPRGISLVAPSGSGKSSAARFMAARFARHGLRARILKLAQPLYDLQRQFYAVAGRDIDPHAQNQKLLEDIATHLRAIDPLALVNRFLARLEAEPADIVINDDLRDMETDLPALIAAGFKTVRIEASPLVRARRLYARADLQTQHASALDGPLQRLRPDHVLVNEGSSLDAYRAEVEAFVDGLVERARIGLVDA